MAEMESRRVPDVLLDDARSFLVGEREPAVARGSSTVMLLRVAQGSASGRLAAALSGDGAGSELEVYVLRRHRRMAFAAGMYAFPGGGIDERDADKAVGWAGPSPEQWARRLACDESEARALVCAAVRETFEESGVLLCGAHADDIVTATTGAEWERDRAALVDRSLAMSDFLIRRGLLLRTDLLGVWAHWITPEFEPRRYDTRFFVAAMPEGQRTRDVSGEADWVAWVKPAESVAAADEGRMAMLPPTYVTLSELARFGEPAEVMAAAAEREIKPIMPSIEMVGGTPSFTADVWNSSSNPQQAELRRVETPTSARQADDTGR
ncbi:MAG: NUDIX hydrolase [Nocardioidaceae bacterium]|nr:NUDIX hydrolase [Nocardioidaceae bacterium]